MSSLAVRRASTALLPFALVFLIIALRYPVALFRSEFWAEDATEFFATAIRLGPASLFLPVYGYHFFLCRIIAYVATAFSVVATPFIYAWSCAVLNTLATGYFSRDGFSWLVPRRSDRLVVCCVLAVGPGASEVFFNLCNLHSSLTLLGLLMLLERPFVLSWRKFSTLVLLILSAGQFVVLFPLIVALGYYTRHLRYYGLAAILLGMSVMNAIGNHEVGTRIGYTKYKNALSAPLVMVENLIERFILGPLLGMRRIELLMSSPWPVYWSVTLVSIAIVGALLWKYRPSRGHRDPWIYLGLAVLGFTSTFGIIAIARGNSLGLLNRESGKFMWDQRYAYLPGALAIILWAAAAVRIPQLGRWGNVLSGILAIVVANHNVQRWSHVYARPNLNWPAHAARIQLVLDRVRRGELSQPIEISGLPEHPSGDGWGSFQVIVAPR